MPRRRLTKSSSQNLNLLPVVRLWILRLLVQLGGHKTFIGRTGFHCDEIASAIGLGKWIDTDDDFSPTGVRASLRKLHKDAESTAHHAVLPVELKENVFRLSGLVGLSATDCRILEFAVLIHSERQLDDAADWIGSLSTPKVFHALSVLLDIPSDAVRAALHPNGVLARSGLVSVSRCGVAPLCGKIDLLSDNFADSMQSPDADPVAMLRDTVAKCSPNVLGLADFEHIASSLAVLHPYLRRSIATGRRGVNIFLHGAPGTGKSQLARALAQDLGCELFEVTSEDDAGDAVNGAQRLRAFRAAQCLFAHRQAILLFDEVEDVFNDGDAFFGKKSTAQSRKAWINRALEENPVPTLWLSNSINGLDPAFIRRFDMVIELPVPPRKQRERILLDACSDLIDETTRVRISGSEALAPAVVARAASVVRSIRDDLGDAGAAKAFELLICNTLDAQGHKAIKKEDPNRLPDVYDPQFIQADADLAQVAAGLVLAKAGRLCLYGPPGTGKTAFGRWLAEQMGVPLLVRKASDLISMYVGGTEKNIARAFRDAQQDGAVLLIDEVDSFLQDRRNARAGWEVTEVNEMLTQMESFSGVFVASTNLMSGLDQAALRRFDLKVKFDFLGTDQAAGLLARHCQSLGLSEPRPEEFRHLGRLRNLTPGDFAAVIRQSRFRLITSPAAMVDALVAECAVKEGGQTSIGFI